MKPRIIFIHGNDTMRWDNSPWNAWLKVELDNAGFTTVFETFPDSIMAREEYWLPFLKDYLRAGENDVLVGWSSGAVAAMRYAENEKIKGSVLIGCNYTDLGDEMEVASGYFDTPWEWEKIKVNQGKIALVYGDDDPYIPQEEFTYIVEKLSPEIIKVAGGKHFIGDKDFPQVLDYILKIYSNG